MKVIEVKDTDRGGKPMAGLKMLGGRGLRDYPLNPVKHRGPPTMGGMKMKSGLSGLSTGRGTALGPSNEAGASPQPCQHQPPRGLPWGYGGVNISPVAVPAPEEDAIDFDVYDVDVYYEVSDEVEVDENDEFSELIEYLDNQWW